MTGKGSKSAPFAMNSEKREGGNSSRSVARASRAPALCVGQLPRLCTVTVDGTRTISVLFVDDRGDLAHQFHAIILSLPGRPVR